MLSKSAPGPYNTKQCACQRYWHVLIRRRTGDGFSCDQAPQLGQFRRLLEELFYNFYCPRGRKLFDAEGEGIHALKRPIVRVGGWIKAFNGAMIEATHPA